MKELKQIIQAYETATQQNKNAVLATVVHIEGSAYRAPGARMLITDDGMLTGAISGGCLEGDVLRKAMSVMISQKPLLITYDTSNDENNVLGVSLGCNGIIKILLEPIAEKAEENPLSLIRRVTEIRKPAVVVTFFSGDRKNILHGTSMAVIDNITYLAENDLPVSMAQLSMDIRAVISAKRSSFVKYPSSAKEPGAIINAFIEYIPPVPALIIAGAGNDVLPVTQLAAILGWDVSLIDGRPAYANAQRFPGCQLMITKPEDSLAKMNIDEQTAILLMSHNYPFDKAILNQAITSPAKYIGILGPRKKRERLINELTEEGMSITAEAASRIFGPTGLDIGAETSEEIALSIITEIKTVFENKPATSLRDRPGQIHERQLQNLSAKQDYAILILAAGLSKRLGQPKQELLYNGDTLLRNAVMAANAIAVQATIVVTGNETVQDQLTGLDAEIAVNPNPEDGLSGSIRTGLSYIKENYPGIKNLLIMLCDQPYVDAAYLARLLEKHQTGNTPVVASYYAGRKGVPAVFDESVFESLAKLQGDTGAKHLIEALGDKVATIDFPEGIIDIDTKQSYQQIIKTT